MASFKSPADRLSMIARVAGADGAGEGSAADFFPFGSANAEGLAEGDATGDEEAAGDDFSVPPGLAEDAGDGASAEKRQIREPTTRTREKVARCLILIDEQPLP